MNSPVDESALNALEFDLVLDVLAQLSHSAEGSERLRALSPSVDVVWIRDELTRVGELYSLFARGGSIGPGIPTDIRSLLRKVVIRGSSLIPEELLQVMRHLRAHSATRKALDRERESLALTWRITQQLAPIPDLERSLSDAISPEGTVNDNASPELGRLRRAIVKQMDRIRQKLAAIVPRLSKQGVLREGSFTMREGRYVLPVRSDAMSKVKGIVHDRSSTGATLFVEPTVLIDLGNELRSLELAERDEVRRILLELTARIRDNHDQISDNNMALVTLDCLAAKASLTERLDALPAAISTEGIIRINRGRHPLLALDASRNVVPLNIELGEDFTTLVISGPNAGGKSVALKCVGLLCLMTACGLNVPVDPGTELPIYDRILPLIGDRQSLSDDLSTFTAHAVGLKDILKQARGRTLVLIDEIGAGTDPQEGSSLSIAVLEKLTERGIHAIVTTHHSALKIFADSNEGCANGSMEFDLDTFEPTYRFRSGIPGSSYALDIARRAGLPDGITGRAREVLGSERSDLEGLISRLAEKVQKYEAMLESESKKIARQEALDKTYDAKVVKLQKRERELKAYGKAEAQNIVKEARRSIELIVKELREKNANRDSIVSAHRELERLEERTGIARHSKKPIKSNHEADQVHEDDGIAQPPSHKPTPETIPDRDPVVGDYVKLDDTTTVGEVTTISSRGDRVCVAIGSIQMWVTRNRVTLVEPPEKNTAVKVFASQPDVPLELDVRGLDAPEALRRVDKYLYDGSASGREKLGIIHGKGAGILSTQIQRMLKDHKLVSEFRFGEYGEGDYGVTLVTLRES